jgi:hypothetical protein
MIEGPTLPEEAPGGSQGRWASRAPISPQLSRPQSWSTSRRGLLRSHGNLVLLSNTMKHRLDIHSLGSESCLPTYGKMRKKMEPELDAIAKELEKLENRICPGCERSPRMPEPRPNLPRSGGWLGVHRTV